MPRIKRPIKIPIELLEQEEELSEMDGMSFATEIASSGKDGVAEAMMGAMASTATEELHKELSKKTILVPVYLEDSRNVRSLKPIHKDASYAHNRFWGFLEDELFLLADKYKVDTVRLNAREWSMYTADASRMKVNNINRMHISKIIHGYIELDIIDQVISYHIDKVNNYPEVIRGIRDFDNRYYGV